MPWMSSTVIVKVRPDQDLLARGEATQPDLGSLQVGQHADRSAGRPGGLGTLSRFFSWSE